MNNTNIAIGAHVLRSNREAIGIVDQVTDSTIRVKHDDRIIEIPLDIIDLQHSSQSKIILSPDFDFGREILEVHAEELHTEIHEVERGQIRIEKRVDHVPFQEDIELGTDVVDVQHLASGQEFDEMPQPRQDGDTLIIPVVEEVVVISRRYRVIEEIHVTKRRELRTEHVEADLRREVVDVKRIDSDEGVSR